MSTSTETEHDEWSEPYYVKGQGWLIADTQGCFAQVRNEATAEQIVADHNSLQSLAAQLESQASTLARMVGERDRLREALRDLLQIVEDEGHADNYIPQVQAARTALTTTTGQEEG